LPIDRESGPGHEDIARCWLVLLWTGFLLSRLNVQAFLPDDVANRIVHADTVRRRSEPRVEQSFAKSSSTSKLRARLPDHLGEMIKLRALRVKSVTGE